jgi:translation initiation factor 3 subunit H
MLRFHFLPIVKTAHHSTPIHPLTTIQKPTNPPQQGGEDEALDEAASANYQIEMMRCLREVNADNNTVGWYQSSAHGAYQTQELVETFVSYHESIRKCVCLVYDPQRSARGQLALKAVRLKDAFIARFREGKVSGKDLREAGIGWRDVFVEVPIRVHSSSLAQALVADLDPSPRVTAADLERLDLGVAGYLGKTVAGLVEGVDDVLSEAQKISAYHRTVARQQQHMAQWLAKRRQENIARRAAGEEALPEEDPAQFKPIPEPPALDQYLVAAQLAAGCDRAVSACAVGTSKLYVMQALQRAARPAAP